MTSIRTLSDKYAYAFAFAQLWVFIGMTSAYDVYISIKTQEYLYEMEMNPIGRFLIEADSGEVALFMGFKFAGTVTALGILVLLYQFKRKWAWYSVWSLSVIQFGVLVMLGT